jgi:hypothetical protein
VDDHETRTGLFDRTVVLFAAMVLIPIVFIISVRWVTGWFAPPVAQTDRQTVMSTPSPSPTPHPVIIAVDHAHFQTGVAVNSYGCPSCIPYGRTDTQWAEGLYDMQKQTDAHWVEIEIDLYQNGINATSVTDHGPTSTPPDAVAFGVQEAHNDGLHVFIVVHLKEGTDAARNWCGPAVLTSSSAARTWFASYWQATEPYLEVAQRVGAEQFALANECNSSDPGQHIEQASPALWHALIAEARGVYHYALGYNMNWQATSPWRAQPWMSDRGLSFIGISMYQPATNSPAPLTLTQIQSVWARTFLPEIDNFSKACGNKPILLSEIGYKDTADALYRPFDTATNSPPDPQLQANAYQAAIKAALGDRRIDGIFAWDWGTGNYGADKFAPNNLPAAQVLHALYQTVPSS